MRRLTLWFFAGIFLAWDGLPAAAEWKGSAAYEWRTKPGDPDRLYLFENNVQVAGYDLVQNIFRTYDAAREAWSNPVLPTWLAPWKSEERPRGPTPNFGVDTEKLDGREECYWINGKKVTRHKAEQALEQGQIPDDSTKLRLTIVGKEAERKQVLNDLAKAPELAEFKDRFLVQDYPPEHWAVARAGFYTSGTPTIYLQRPDGKVLHRQDEYDGAGGLARALRRADENYETRKDPDLRKQHFLGIDLAAVPVPVWVLGAAGLVVLFIPRRGKS